MTAKAPPPAPPARKTILIVDDHPILRRGLTALIESDPGLTVCAEAATEGEALQAVAAHAPDLVIVDLMLESSDGLELIKKISERHPEVLTLVLTLHDEALYGERTLRAGARGFVSKRQLDETMLIAIHQVLAGETYLSSTLSNRLAAKYLDGKTIGAEPSMQLLSDRELQVFRALGQGQSVRHIADALHLSVKTIESHVEHIKRKLGVASGRDLAERAARWVESGDAG